MGVLDAWAYGVAVVTTPVGGLMDIVEDGISGLLYDVHDIDKLSQCLDLLMNSEELRRKIVKEADKYVDNEFSIKTITAQLDSIYSSI